MQESKTTKDERPTISTQDVRALERALRALKTMREKADETMHMLLDYLSQRRQLP